MTTSRFRPSRVSGCLVAVLLATTAQATEVVVPSGLTVTLFDVILEEDTNTARFRFAAPQIDIAGEAVPFAQVAGDFQFLCDTVLLPGLLQNGWTTGQVVVSWSSREIPFGATALDVTQFFQPFTIADAACVWEDF